MQCINYGASTAPKEIAERAVCLDGDMGKVLKNYRKNNRFDLSNQSHQKRVNRAKCLVLIDSIYFEEKCTYNT